MHHSVAQDYPTLFFQQLGDSSNPDLVLLHGWGMNSGVWHELLGPLTKHFHVTIVDLFGHGRTPHFASADFAVRVEQLYKQLPVENAVWLGWSWGGLFVLEIARRYPQSCSRLMLMASSPCFAQRNDWASAMPVSQLDTFHDSLLQDMPKTIKRFIALQCLQMPDAKQVARDIEALVTQAPATQEGLLQGLDDLKQQDLRAGLKVLKQPVSMLFGRLDALVPQSAATAVAAISSDIAINVLDHAAHAPFVSHRHDVLQWVLSTNG